MADFCKHCSIAIWGEDTKDLADLGPTADEIGRPWYYPVLCEGCGSIMVNSKGERCNPLDQEDEGNRHLTTGHFFNFFYTL
jgi:hypothetical protein